SMQWYISPIQEIPNEFKDGRYRIAQLEKNWFEFGSYDLRCSSTRLFSTDPYLIITPILNGIMICSSLGFFLLGGYKRAKPQMKQAVLLATFFWLANFIFSVIAAPTMLRYGIPLMSLNIAFGMLQVDWIRLSDRVGPNEKLNYKNVIYSKE